MNGAAVFSSRTTKDGPQARRLLALAAIYEGVTRTEAARIGRDQPLPSAKFSPNQRPCQVTASRRAGNRPGGSKLAGSRRAAHTPAGNRPVGGGRHLDFS